VAGTGSASLYTTQDLLTGIKKKKSTLTRPLRQLIQKAAQGENPAIAGWRVTNSFHLGHTTPDSCRLFEATWDARRGCDQASHPHFLFAHGGTNERPSTIRNLPKEFYRKQ
jgi:hypothetical protein